MKPTVLCFVFLCCSAPALASAAIKVSKPTGNAPSSFLSELKRSLESVTAESNLQDIGDAELRAVATTIENGYSITIALSSSDFPEISQNREVTTASALPQARAMARTVIGDHNKQKSNYMPKVMPEKVTALSATIATPLDEPYQPRKALGWSLTTTLLGTAAGVGILVPGFMKDNAMVWVGLGVAGAALAIGPSTGIYYANRPIRASITLGVRTALLGGWIGWFAHDWSQPEGSFGAAPPVSLFVLPIFGITVLVLTINDIVTAPRSARKKNEEFRKSTVAIIPTMSLSQDGNRATGLAIAGQF